MLGFRKNKTSTKSDKPEKAGLFKRLKQGLSRTRQSLTGGVADLLLGSKSMMLTPCWLHYKRACRLFSNRSACR
jgi:hypothetical protein